MNFFYKIIPQSQYARNIILLMTGTGLAQAIPVAISPILTRLYSPEEFGIFALFMAIVSIAAVLVTGRYELAIMLPKSDRDAMHIVALSVVLSCIISAVLLIFVVIFNTQITDILEAPQLSNWLYWGPASTLLLGVNTSLSYWSNRKGNYRRLSTSRIIQSGSTSFVQLGGGYANTGASGLLGGQLIGQLFATTALLRLIYIQENRLLKLFSKIRLLMLAKRFIKFPKYMILGQLLNVASGNLPLFLLSIFYGPAIAGFYSLAQRVLVAPISLIGGALGDVYRSEAAKIYREKGSCQEIFKKTFLKLAVVSVVIVTPIYFFGESLFSIIFGEKWRVAGEISSLISVMIFFQAISSPLSQTVLFAEKQRLDLFWQGFRFILAGASLYVGYYFFKDYKISLILFSFSFSFLYSVHSLFQYFVAKGWR